MAKIKVECYAHKKYYDIFFESIQFLTDRWIKVFEIFRNIEVIVSFDIYEAYDAVASLIEKDMGLSIIMTDVSQSICIFECNQIELINLLRKLDVDYLEDITVVGKTNQNMLSGELIHLILNNPNSIMKQGISDIMLDINFNENEMSVSVVRIKYAPKAIKNFVLNIFND